MLKNHNTVSDDKVNCKLAALSVKVYRTVDLGSAFSSEEESAFTKISLFSKIRFKEFNMYSRWDPMLLVH